MSEGSAPSTPQTAAPAQSQTPDHDIFSACQRGLDARVRYLVEQEGVDVRVPQSDSVTALHWAAINNRTELCRFLVSMGAVVDAVGGELKATPLLWAARQGALETVVCLVQHSANPLLRDTQGFNALTLAVQFNHPLIVAYLLSRGVSADVTDLEGRSPLMWSVAKHFHEVTRLLLGMRASANMADGAGNTALHWACRMTNMSSARVLVEQHHADMHAINSKGESPLQIALKLDKGLHTYLRERQMRESPKTVGERVRGLLSDQLFRKRAQFILPFVFIPAIGMGFVAYSWAVGLLLAIALVALFVYTVSRLLLRQTGANIASFGVYTASKFWVVVTFFTLLLPASPPTTLALLFVVLLVPLIYFFHRSIFTDPGFLTSTPLTTRQADITHLIESGEAIHQRLCTSCVLVKPLRSKHCRMCDRCVSKMDHHCPFVNNCVGETNHRFFVTFSALFVTIAIVFIVMCNRWMGAHLDLAALPAAPSLGSRLYAYGNQFPFVNFMMYYTCFHTLWVGGLLVQQLYLLLTGFTTNEYYNKWRYSYMIKSAKGAIVSPFSHGLLRNFVDFFHLSLPGLPKPVVLNWKKVQSVAEAQAQYARLSGSPLV